MKQFFLFFIGSLSISLLFAQSDLRLHFDSPASQFTESIPLGNGRLGAMVFGRTNKERIVLNEKSMWSGGVQDPNRHDAHKHLPEIQKLLQEEKNEEAQKLLQQHFVCAGKGSGFGNGAHVKYGSYQVLSDLFLQWTDTNSVVTNYSRKLELDKAIGIVEWRRNGIQFKEEIWVSAPQQVIVIRLTADKKNSLNFILEMKRKERASFSSASNSITMKGQLDGGDGDAGINFAAYAKVITPKGSVLPINGGLVVNADKQCIIIISAHTDLNWPNVELRGPAPLPLAMKRVKTAAVIPIETLLQNHITDYQSLFNRCS
jgi:alpha-L-fucosidase 2